MNALVVEAVEDLARLEELRAPWQALARRTMEPNAFYEPEYVLPGIKHLKRSDERVSVVFVWRRAPASGELVAVLPVTISPRTKNLPIPSLGAWRHVHAFLGTPLVDPDNADQTIAALIDWARARARGTCVFRLDRYGADGPFQAALTRALDASGIASSIDEQFVRPLFRRDPALDFDACFKAAADGVRRRKYRAWARHLADAGELTYTLDADPNHLAPTLSDYLDLEARSWKGDAGTALSQTPQQRAFFLEVAEGFSRRADFEALAVRVTGKPVAIRTSLRAGPASFCFKTAFDPAFSQSSPGTVLEVEQLRRMTLDPRLEWSDSCASSSTTPLRWLWTHSREIRSLLIPSRTLRGRVLIASLPILKKLSSRKRPISGNIE